MKVVIIGSGNVAWHLAQGFEQAGLNVVEVYSRNRKKAKKITSILYESEATNSLNFRDSEATFFFMAVSDKAIAEVAREILLPTGAFLVHCSGSVPLEVLELARGQNEDLEIGVLYPLMTFTTGIRVELSTTPFLIEGTDLKYLKKVTQSISKYSEEADSSHRLAIHAAAVFSNNFTNHILALAKELCDTEDVNYDLLKPLVKETLRKSLTAEHPADVQTGPALREDLNTLSLHRSLLQENDPLLKVYDTLTQSIAYWHID